ncbi:MAG: superoxide dismutase family protein [Faecousia sp.]
MQLLQAQAKVKGGKKHPNLHGTVRFTARGNGTLVAAEICGLPESETGFFAFHIHEGEDCGGEGFSDTKGHMNPCNRAHPCHAGDLPPLLSCNGRAEMTVFTERFSVCDILGKTVVIHAEPDDFHTQPSGNAGTKIACGVIRAR